tara:strand:+ start:635 stop:1678 length:1044 start_codon:yes stop_codon:yes gene_type:complete
MEKQISYFSQTDVGKTRDHNEDCIGDRIISKGHVFVVCDGMGGHIGGEKASILARDSILDHCERSKGENPVQMIHEAIKFANTQVHGFSTTNIDYAGMGTTCVVVLVTNENQTFIGHVGDSRCYMHSNSDLTKLTKDHSYVQFLFDTGEINEDEMETHPNKNQILRAIGTNEIVKPEICLDPIIMHSGDSLIICSDGLTGMVNDRGLKKILDVGGSAEDRVTRLIDAANRNGGKDNISVIIVDWISNRVDHGSTKLIPPLGRPSKKREFPLKFLVFFGIVLILIAATIIGLQIFFNNEEVDIVDQALNDTCNTNSSEVSNMPVLEANDSIMNEDSLNLKTVKVLDEE